ncbi:MAG: hypothetical protein AAF483_13865, partial [Planctomycetota bacterium]
AALFSASGPWQWKHLSDKIGRTSRSKRIGSLPNARETKLTVKKASKEWNDGTIFGNRMFRME